MVNSYINTLTDLVKYNSDIISLVVDDGEIYNEMYKRVPKQIINVGISECNSISVSAGLASCGKIPFVAGGNSFMAYRAYEFIRDQLCMQNRNVKVVGIGAGLAISVLGNTQHATEDLSALRALPNLTIMTPATVTEVKHMVRLAAEINGPVFIRIGRSAGEDFYNGGVKFEPYKIQKVREGNDLKIISTGSMVCEVLKVADLLYAHGIETGVVNVHTIKPIDKEGIKNLSKECHKWISVEEHNLNGGLGGALAEIIVDEKLRVEMYRIGLNDCYPVGHGAYEDIKRVNGLGIMDIFKRCLDIALS